MPKFADPKALITKKAEAAIRLEQAAHELILHLKEAQSEIDNQWTKVQKAMIDNDIKSIKRDWGALTIAERLNWQISEDLPKKFYKKVVDTKKITDTYRLEGKAPKGAYLSVTKYLVRRIK